MELEQATLSDIRNEIQRRVRELNAFLLPSTYTTNLSTSLTATEAIALTNKQPARLGRNLRESVLLTIAGRTMSRGQIAKEIRGYDVKSIGATLALLCRQKALKRVSRGIYTVR